MNLLWRVIEMGERIAELGKFLSGIMPDDAIYMNICRVVEDAHERLIGDLCGFYQSHTARGTYEITVQLSLYYLELTTKLEEGHMQPSATISGIEEKVLDGKITITFSENDNSEEAIFGFGRLEKVVEADYR